MLCALQIHTLLEVHASVEMGQLRFFPPDSASADVRWLSKTDVRGDSGVETYQSPLDQMHLT